MYKTVAIVVFSVLSLATVSAVVSSSGGNSNEDNDNSDHQYESDNQEYGGSWFDSRADIIPSNNETYLSECGDCHFAYQPGLLPQTAWNRVMDVLENHFGDDASLDETSISKIRAYLVENAADRTKQSRSRAFAVGSKDGSALPRITETRYFRSEHHEIPDRFVRDNPDVGRFSNCQSCHLNADAGIYNEHQVVIPGYGRWDD